VLDLLVFAPLGFALEAKRLLPTLVSRGKREVSNARVIGSFVTPIAKRKAERFLVETVRGERAHPKPRANSVTSASPPVSSVVSPAPRSGNATGATNATTTTTATTAAEPSTITGETFPIENYDQLPSSTIVELIDRLSPSERLVIASYEQANRKRRTILTKIAQAPGRKRS
jgi:hypothetical protein